MPRPVGFISERRFELGREQEVKTQIERLYWNEQLPQREVERRLGVCHATLWKMMQRLGISTRSTGEANLLSYKQGDRQPCWKSSDLRASGKQVRRKVPGHLRATPQGHVQEHYLVLEQAGIEVPPGYEVHHDDGNRANNELSNLKVVTKSEHALLHHKSLQSETRRI